MKLDVEQIEEKGSVKPSLELTYQQILQYIHRLKRNNDDFQRKKEPLEHLIIVSYKDGIITAEQKNSLLNELTVKDADGKSPTVSKVTPARSTVSLISPKNKAILAGSLGLTVIIVIVLYIQFFFHQPLPEDGAVQGVQEPVASEQVLRFKGVLYDRNGDAIQDKVDVKFAIYSSISADRPVYEGVCYGENGLTPDSQGSFTVAIGLDCDMPPLPESILTNMKNTYLGITVGKNPELKPRYPIATVDYSKNAEQIQGLSPGNNESTIPYIDQEGVFKIAAVSPLIQSTAGIFTVEGQSVVLQATDTENGAVVIGGPAGLGLQTSQIIDAITVGGNISPDKNYEYNLGSETSYFNTTYTRNVVVAEEGIGAYWQRKEGVVSPTYLDDSVALGFVSGSKPTIYLSSDKEGVSWVVNRAFGIGTTTPAYLFTASGSIAGTSTVSLSNLSKSDNNLTNVLRLNLGSSASSASFIDFYANSTSDTNGKKVGSIGMENGNLTFKTGGADFAEYMEVVEETEPGMIIAATRAGNANAVADERPIGVITDVAGIIGNYDAEDEKNSALIGLLGQIPTFVSTLQGEIVPGTPIGVSIIPGYGQHAVSAQTIVGTVIGNAETVKNQLGSENCPKAFRTMSDPTGNPIRCGRVPVLVSPQWYEPGLTSEEIIHDDMNTTPEYSYQEKFESDESVVEIIPDEQKTPLERYIERSKQNHSIFIQNE